MGAFARMAETPCECAAPRQASRRVIRLYDQALAPFGLRITQYPILAWLAVSGPVTLSTLAARMVRWIAPPLATTCARWKPRGWCG